MPETVYYFKNWNPCRHGNFEAVSLCRLLPAWKKSQLARAPASLQQKAGPARQRIFFVYLLCVCVCVCVFHSPFKT
jgi:hypothetical protein